MSAQFDSKPDLIRPANQKLIFAISDTGTAPDRFVVTVDEDGTEIAKLFLTPNPSSKAFFDLSEVAKERVKVDSKIRDESAFLFSYKTLLYTTGRTGLRKYDVKLSSFNNNAESATEATATIYLVDGAEQISAGLHPSFSTYYSTATTNKLWLTDRKKQSIEGVDYIVLDSTDVDEAVIAIINDSSLTSGLVTQLQYLIFNGVTSLNSELIPFNTTDGAQLPNASDANQKLTYVSAGIANFENPSIPSNKRPSNYGDNWTHIILKPATNAGPYGTPLYIRRVCNINKNEQTQLAWSTTRGGWDFLTFTGRTERTDVSQNKAIQTQVGDYNGSTYSFLGTDRQSRHYQITAKSKFQLRRKDFSFADIELLRYCLRSDDVYIRLGTGEWQPVILDTSTYNVKQPFSGLFDVSLDATLAQTLKC